MGRLAIAEGWERVGATVSIVQADLSSGTYNYGTHALSGPIDMREFRALYAQLEGAAVNPSAAGWAIVAVVPMTPNGRPVGQFGNGSVIAVDSGTGAVDAGAKTLVLGVFAGMGVGAQAANTRDVAGEYSQYRSFGLAVPPYLGVQVYLALGASGTITGSVDVSLWGYRG